MCDQRDAQAKLEELVAAVVTNAWDESYAFAAMNAFCLAQGDDTK